MSTFRVPVLTVESCDAHPAADRLSVVRVRGYEAVVPRNPDGSHRHPAGSRVAYVPVGGELPEPLLRRHGFWKGGKGTLFGQAGNRVSLIELRGRPSMGLVLPLPDWAADEPVGTCLAERLGVTKYVPEVPPSLRGQAVVRMEAKVPYAIEHLLTYPRLLEGHEVVATEKVHGVCSKVTYVPGMSDPEAFGAGDVTVTSKGLGERGMVFANVPANDRNPYVVTALEHGIPARLAAWAERNAPGMRVTLVSEVYGVGIQDLGYGSARPSLRAIDLQAGFDWIPEDAKAEAFAELGLDRVPILHRGPYDLDLLMGLRSGASTLPGARNIREGIVVESTGPQTSRATDLGTFVRPKLKLHSPEYDFREDGTEHG